LLLSAVLQLWIPGAVVAGFISNTTLHGIYVSVSSHKSIFAENSVATPKQYSTSINTDKIENTTIKSITSSFFTKLNYLLYLITKFAKAIHCGNVSYYKHILPF